MSKNNRIIYQTDSVAGWLTLIMKSMNIQLMLAGKCNYYQEGIKSQNEYNEKNI